MNRKIIMGVAAVAGIGLLLFLRSSAASKATSNTGGVLTSNTAALNEAMGNASGAWAKQPVTITVNQTKPAVADTVAASPAPAPASSGGAPVAVFGGTDPARASAPAPSGPVAVFGGTMPGAPAPDALVASDGGTFGYLTPEQRRGRTDAQIITGMMF